MVCAGPGVGLERKNGWTLAEFAGDVSPDGMQRLLNAAAWDEDKVRDALGRYVAARLGDPGGVLIADETGFEKAGVHSAGVQRQYTGTAGKITNCQVGMFLAYAVPAAGTRVLIDRELYLPKSWAEDGDRCAAAGIPQDAKFATKPALAKKMIERAVRAGLPFSWFTADEAYGDNGKLRDWLEENKVAYVVAVACDHQVPAGAGRTIRADALAAKIPPRGWQRMSCGPGSKGERLYDWALSGAGGGRQLLIRRSISSGELACYLCWSPRTASSRAREGPASCGQLSGPRPEGRSRLVTGSHDGPMICLTMNEIRRMHALLCRPAHPPHHHLRWSTWRRRHQARARHCHTSDDGCGSEPAPPGRRAGWPAARRRATILAWQQPPRSPSPPAMSWPCPKTATAACAPRRGCGGAASRNGTPSRSAWPAPCSGRTTPPGRAW